MAKLDFVMKRERRYVDDPYVELDQYGREIIESEKYRRLLDFEQHHNSTTFKHSISVALKALSFAHDHHIKVDVEALVKMCLLHDYFLYDWHIKPHPEHHATMHPIKASKNAKRDFGIDEFVSKGIESHMWPLPLRRIPQSREAWILAYADKCVTINEVFGRPQRCERKRLRQSFAERRGNAVLDRCILLANH